MLSGVFIICRMQISSSYVSWAFVIFFIVACCFFLWFVVFLVSCFFMESFALFCCVFVVVLCCVFQEYLSYADQFKYQLEHAAEAIALVRENPKFMMQHMAGDVSRSPAHHPPTHPKKTTKHSNNTANTKQNIAKHGKTLEKNIAKSSNNLKKNDKIRGNAKENNETQGTTRINNKQQSNTKKNNKNQRKATKNKQKTIEISQKIIITWRAHIEQIMFMWFSLYFICFFQMFFLYSVFQILSVRGPHQSPCTPKKGK